MKCNFAALLHSPKFESNLDIYQYLVSSGASTFQFYDFHFSGYEPSTKTEYIRYNKPSEGRESLPYPAIEHCMVKLNESMIMFIGGVNQSTVYFYTFIPGDFYGLWSHGPSLPQPRNGHACEKIQIEKDHDAVVVTGGFNGTHFLKSTQILDLNHVERGWKNGPEMPGNPRMGARLISRGRAQLF